VPVAWAAELAGLPGFDPATGTIVLDGVGRCHPVTRRAIASVRHGRVCAARGERLSLLATYAVEIGTMFRRIVGLQLFPDGTAAEIGDPLALAQDAVPADGLWQSRFADWAPGMLATATPPDPTAGFRQAHQAACDNADAVAAAWLRRRADDLCGAPEPWIGDLFGDTAETWRTCSDPEQRLTMFATDSGIPSARREAAEAVLKRFRTVTVHPPLPAATTRVVGYVMAVP
jgi:hypothetical protein